MIPFDKRQGEIWLDGDFVPWAEARLHVLSHGLHYGGSAFEGERAYNGRIFKLEEHSARLVDSARILDMDMKWTADEISAASAETIVRNGLNEAYIRPVIWRGAEGLGIGADGLTTHLAIAAWRWNDAFPPKAYTHGIRLATASWRRPNPMTAPTKAKAGGLYSIGTLAKHEAIRKGAQDALMLDWRGRVAESTGANIFFVRDGALVTPPPEGFLDGITRRTVISLADTLGIDVDVLPLWPADLFGMEEAFLCGTAAEILPIGAIDDSVLAVGPVTKKIMEAYGECRLYTNRP